MAYISALRIILVIGTALSVFSASHHARAATPFPLGVYVGNPNGSNAQDEAAFEANYARFVATMGTAPSLILSYIDYTQPISAWISNSAWQAWSNAQSPDARGLVPVIALPLYSIAAGSPSPDQQYQAFIAGSYDAVLQGVVDAWAKQGFTKLYFRPGWEMNIQGNTYVGSDAQSQSDWVLAFRHIFTVLHEAAAASGISVQIVWNPNVTNYTSPSATKMLYPGDAYVDVVGADAYADMYPFSDGGNPATYHDWDSGQEDTSIAQFIADAVNRAHYWTWPAATKYSQNSSQGHSQTMASLMSFAAAHAKPFAIAEAGAGNCNASTDVCDELSYPAWLAATLRKAAGKGLVIDFINIWDSNGGGNYEFSYPSDNKPNEATAWGKAFGQQ